MNVILQVKSIKEFLFLMKLFNQRFVVQTLNFIGEE